MTFPFLSALITIIIIIDENGPGPLWARRDLRAGLHQFRIIVARHRRECAWAESNGFAVSGRGYGRERQTNNFWQARDIFNPIMTAATHTYNIIRVV